MTFSMRRQTALAKQRDQRDSKRKECRERAYELLRTGTKVAEVSRITDVSRSTCDRIKNAMDSNDEENLGKLLNPKENRAGRRCVITSEEDDMIRKQIDYAASRGFAWEKEDLKRAMTQISRDGRAGFRTKTKSASDDAVRAWRARNRETTYRYAENKSVAKLRAERYDHVASLERALKEVEKRNPNIFSHAERLWNMDETAIEVEYGKKRKVFSSSKSHHGGTKSQRGGKQSKHITAVVAVSASGRKTPPIFIVAGKNIMSSWFQPLSVEQIMGDTRLQWLTADDWFPRDAVVLMTENGSIEKRIIKYIIQHINKHVRKILPEEDRYCLTLDGHTSRKGVEWLQYARSVNCEVVQLPSDTSHFLQACDRKVNKKIKNTMREYRDMLNKCFCVDPKTVQISLMIGVGAYASIDNATARQSFAECGLWPMNFRFLNKFEWQKNIRDDERAVKKQLDDGSVATRVQNVALRKTDEEIYDNIKKIIADAHSASKAIQAIQAVLRKQQSTNKIIRAIAAPVRGCDLRLSKGDRREVLYSGTPAMCLSFGEILAQREAQKIASRLAEQEKERIKRLKMNELEARKVEKEQAKRNREAVRAERKAQQEKKRVEREMKKPSAVP